MNRHTRHLIPIAIAALATLPGVYLRLSGMAHRVLEHPTPESTLLVAATAGVAILGAAFLLLWACDAAQADISQTPALAVVALIAVLPEYAVDMYFTWQAGKDPQYAQYAIANMTGANRLLIGVAWSLVAVLFWFKTRRAVRLGPERRTELFFLGLATAYAFVIPLKGSLAWYDGVVFLGIYVWYIVIAGRRPCEECEGEGPAELLLNLPRLKRRLATLVMLLFAAGVIIANAEPFSEGLVATGTQFAIDEFLLVQWLAPLASEAPEFIVAIMFALRGQAGLALGCLLSAKLNQWTLLVGMIPGVYAVSSGGITPPIPMGSFQMHEILLTAAQSLLAVVILATLRLSISQALLIFGLFIGQFLAPVVVGALPGHTLLGLEVRQVHQLFSVLYLACALTLFLDNPSRLKDLWKGLRVNVAEGETPLCALPDAEPVEETVEAGRV